MRNYSDPARGIAVTFSAEGLISSLSPNAEQATGYSAQDLTGRPITQILADRSVFEVPQMMKSAREWGVWQGDIKLRNRSGEALEAHGSLAPLAGKENEISGYLLISDLEMSFISEPSSDEMLRDIGAKLRMFSHELNNPLAVIMGFTQLILLNPRCGSEVRGDLEKVYSELKRIVQVVERVHTYAIGLQEDHRIKEEPEVVIASTA